MSYQVDRIAFLLTMQQEGMAYSTTLQLLRYATTLHRLAEAQCNGDWPADNGNRTVRTCTLCERAWVPETFRRGLCLYCRTTQRVRARMPTGFRASIDSDPRGTVLTITVPSGTTDDWGHSGICVPSRH